MGKRKRRVVINITHVDDADHWNTEELPHVCRFHTTTPPDDDTSPMFVTVPKDLDIKDISTLVVLERAGMIDSGGGLKTIKFPLWKLITEEDE